MKNGILIPDRKMVYWFIPKCACTTMKTVIAHHLGLEVPEAWKKVHGLPFRFIHHGQAVQYRDWQHFTVVRHPMRRTLSLFNNKIFRDGRTIRRVKDGVTQPIFSNYGSLFYADMSFPDFVRAICRVLDNRADPHIKAMAKQLPYIHIKVFKSEEMETVAEYLSENGINQPFPHLNKTTGESWLDNYTPELAEMIYQAYEVDFQRFQYKNPFNV